MAMMMNVRRILKMLMMVLLILKKRNFKIKMVKKNQMMKRVDEMNEDEWKF